MAVKRPGDKATKAQIMDAFDQLESERKELEDQVKKLQKEVKEKPVIVQQPQPSVKEIKPVQEVKEVKEVKQMIEQEPPVIDDKMNYTLDILAKLQLGFGSTISELSEKLTTEAGQLQQFRTLVNQELEELNQLHNLEVVEDTLDNLIENYQGSSKQFKEEFTTRKETLEQETLELKKTWQKSQEEYQVTIKERNENQAKSQQRDEEEYQYDLSLRRELNEEQYQITQQALYKELEEIKQEQEKQWNEKEKAIAEREKQQKEAKEKVESFEKEKDLAIKKAKDEGRGLGNYHAKIKSDMLGKEIEGQKRLYEQQIQSLEQTINVNNERLMKLSQQLEAAQKQVQDLAVKAIEGTANINSLQAFKDLAMEQAKSQGKIK